MMIKTTKIILLIQVIACVLMPAVIFNVPLELARIAHEAHGLATQLQKGGSADIQAIAKANEVAVYLRAWRNAIPFVIVVISILGALVGLLGWQTLNRAQKKIKVEPENFADCQEGNGKS